MTIRSAWSKSWKALTLAASMAVAGCGDIQDGTSETGYRTIGATGGEVKAKDTVVTVPEGAVESALTVTIAPAPAEELPEGTAGKAVDVGPEGAEFLQPVSVQLAYDPDALPDTTRADLTWVGGVVDGEWEPLLDPVIDEEARLVRGTTRRAGRFGVVHGCGRGRRCPNALAFDSAPQRVEAGACSGAAVLKAIDASGRRSPVLRDTAVALSADELSLRFYADDGCQREISSLTIPARQTDATFYFRGRAARSVTLTAQARDLRPGSQDETIYPGAGVTFGFATAPQRVYAGRCSSVVTVAFEDAYGNRAPVPSDARVTLSSAATIGTVTFYSDDTCTTSTSGITMPSGTASVSFWFKDDFGPTANTDTVTITTSVGAFGGGFTASQDQAAQSSPPAAVRFFSLAQTVNVGACSGTTMVGLVDDQGNRTSALATTSITLQTSAGMALYSDSACTAQISSLRTIPAGQNATTFYWKAFNTGTYTITASSTGLSSDSQAETAQ
jgi:hypothetical protein